MMGGGRVKNGSPTRADFDRLKAEHDRLRAETELLRDTTRKLRQDLQTQFTRIAEMQAILGERRIATSQHHDPPPICRAMSSR